MVVKGTVTFKTVPVSANTTVFVSLMETGTVCGTFQTDRDGVYKLKLPSECNLGTLVFTLFGVKDTTSDEEVLVSEDMSSTDIEFSKFSFDTTPKMEPDAIEKKALGLQPKASLGLRAAKQAVSNAGEELIKAAESAADEAILEEATNAILQAVKKDVGGGMRIPSRRQRK